MHNMTLKQKRSYAQRFVDQGVSYDDLDALCMLDLTQNKISSDNLYNLLEMIYVGTGKIPVFHEDRITFDSVKHPVVALPKFLRFSECPVSAIPGHKKDREIFESFYPIIDSNMGMYFRVALAWLGVSDQKRAAALLHVSNRDFDQMRRLKIYVPVITNKDMRMDIMAMSFESFMPLMLNHHKANKVLRYMKFDPRSGARTPIETEELVPKHALDQIDHIRRIQYPEFYESMLDYIRERRISPGAYTCGQFLLDLQMRT